MKARGKISGILRYAVFLVFFTLLALEVLLRFIYPFPNKVRGERFELATNTTYRLVNDFNPRLDSLIINHRNSLGFRGAEPARKKGLFILASGGSTTACTFLSEGHTWCDMLQQLSGDSVTVNNAGLDGHSSFGNLALLKYYLPGLPVKPDIILFMCGANDVDRNDLPDYNMDQQKGFFQRSKSWLRTHSETLRLITDLKNRWFPNDIYSDRRYWQFANAQPLELSNAYIDSSLFHQEPLLKNYRARLDHMITLCREQGIQPVFISQALAYTSPDKQTPVSGNPLQRMNQMDNGLLFYRKLQLYNTVTRETCLAKQIPFIDLAEKLPADTTFFYDPVHFTNRGADTVGKIIYQELAPILRSR